MGNRTTDQQQFTIVQTMQAMLMILNGKVAKHESLTPLHFNLRMSAIIN
jgi:hypothetical protein